MNQDKQFIEKTIRVGNQINKDNEIQFLIKLRVD